MKRYLIIPLLLMSAAFSNGGELDPLVLVSASDQPHSSPPSRGDWDPRWDQDLSFGFHLDYHHPVDATYTGVYSGSFYGEVSLSRYASGFFSAGLGALEVDPASGLPAYSPGFGELGMGLRLYLTPSYVFLRPYVTIRGSLMAMAWDYRFPVLSRDGNSVKHDWTWDVADAYAGVGISTGMMREESLRIFAEIGVGTFIFPETSNQNVDMVFKDFSYVGGRLGICVTF